MFSRLLNTWPDRIGSLIAVVGFLFLLAGCATMIGLDKIIVTGRNPIQPTIAMGKHIERGAPCLTCHPGAKNEKKAGIASADYCISCHAGLPSGFMFEEGGEFINVDGTLKTRVQAILPSNVSFSHANHKEHECAVCHGDIEKDDYSMSDLASRYENCRRCHTDGDASDGCEMCHTSFDPKRRPHSHSLGWERSHGREVSLSGGIDTARESCAKCHGADYCASCHSTNKPENHSEFWDRAGHGLVAAMDRSRCAACHTQDACVRCHQGYAPPMPVDGDHVGSMMPSGCFAIGCHPEKTAGHVILTENCGICHRR
ncbi:MAG: hypothetical protein ABIH86_06030 [Planctomycetota bacterium]